MVLIVPSPLVQVATYISVLGILNNAVDDVPNTSLDLESNFRTSFNELRHQSASRISEDMRKFMSGDKNIRNQTLLSIMTGKEFFAPDPDMSSRVQTESERIMYAVAVNALWGYDRAYILDTNAPLYGDCKTDLRGAIENRVCLPEFSNRTFWLYALNPSQEGDTHDQVQVHGPIGYRNFFSEHDGPYNITKEDIVRSSYFVHKHNLQATIDNIDFEKIGSEFNKSKDLGKVPGAFTVPVCRNPAGESISSVWDDKGRNYPCMCGEFRWNKGEWSLERDQTKNFLRLTGLMFSEDFEDYCFSHNHCRGRTDIDWHRDFEAMRKPGDPKIPKRMKHPFKKCKSPKDHRIGHPEKDFNW